MKRIMTHPLSFAAIIAGVLFLGFTKMQPAQSQQDAYRIENFHVSGPANLDVKTSGGSIRVYGSESDEVKVEMYVRKGNKYIKPGRLDLSKWEIEIRQDGTRIMAEARRSSSVNWPGSRESISFVVYAPKQTTGTLSTSGGSIKLENLQGRQHAKTSGGSVTAADISGETELITSGGSIKVEKLSGNLTAHTSGGSIKINDAEGAIDVKTSGGSITLKAIKGGVRAKTSGGSIKAEILAPDKAIDLRTSGGSISINLPESIGYDLDLAGSRVRLPEDMEILGRMSTGKVTGKLNNGGIRLYAHTSGGSVNLGYN